MTGRLHHYLENQAFLFALYKLWKWFHHALTGTSELFRICDGAVARANGLHSIGLVTAVTRNTTRGEEEVELYENKQLDGSVSGSEEMEPTDEAALVFRIDRCLMYSSKLLVERRQLEAKDSNVDAAVASILRKKGFPENGSPSTPQAIVLRRCAWTIAASYKLMHDLNARAATKYDSSNKTHERKLLDFWELASPGQRLESRISEQWTTLGFQGHDPATDFRGMGLLALDDLHYYAKVHPQSFHRVLASSHHETAWFSMAVVGIHITSFCISLIRTRQLQNFMYTYGTTKESYEEFYCYVFDSFEKHWTSSTKPLTVMDFNRVFTDFQVRIERKLLEGVPTVLDEQSPVLLPRSRPRGNSRKQR
ncbi:hypothetical protein HK405_011834 [Cladochytrium tenue]|nr:hypothetical protein HK405_011834 [Cladochytrium tenue]